MKKLISILIALCTLLPNTALAGLVSFHPAEHLDRQDKPFTTTLVLDTTGDSINTIEGVLMVDPRLSNGTTTDIQVSDSGSIITYWITPPIYDKQQHTIRFAGGIPGGYTGSTGIILSIIIPPYSGEPIDRAISVRELRAYKNDGEATSANISSANFSLGDIAGEVDQGVSDQLYIDGTRKDDIPPEVFSPQISRDPNVFNGHWFINFSTVDKQSGIDHYEIQETQSGSMDSGNWKIATSPYELQDQDLHSFVYVIAIDRQGNERIIKVFPRNPLSWWQLYGKEVGAIALLAIVAGAVYFRRRQNHKRKTRTHHSNNHST
jgi:hypothetical protein